MSLSFPSTYSVRSFALNSARRQSLQRGATALDGFPGLFALGVPEG
ncbi:MAG: hypothetical protein RMY35_004555 [Nostoc sp. DedSLP01]